MTGDRKFPHLTAAKKQCGTKRSKNQKICCSRAASTPAPRLCAGIFTRSQQEAEENRGVRACPEKVARLFRYLAIGYIRWLMRTCSNSLILRGILIDLVVPLDPGAR